MARPSIHLPLSRVGITREAHRTLLGIALLMMCAATPLTLPLVTGPSSLDDGFGLLPAGMLAVMFVLSVLIPAKLGEKAGALDVGASQLVVRCGSRVHTIPRRQMVVGWVFDSVHGPRFAIQLTTGEVISAVVPSHGHAQLVLDQLGLDGGPMDLALARGSCLRMGDAALELMMGWRSRRIAFSEVREIETTFGGLTIVTNAGERVSLPLVSRRSRGFDFLRTVADRLLPAPSSAESQVERIEAIAQRIRTAVHQWRRARAKVTYRVCADMVGADTAAPCVLVTGDRDSEADSGFEPQHSEDYAS